MKRLYILIILYSISFSGMTYSMECDIFEEKQKNEETVFDILSPEMLETIILYVASAGTVKQLCQPLNANQAYKNVKNFFMALGKKGMSLFEDTKFIKPIVYFLYDQYISPIKDDNLPLEDAISAISMGMSFKNHHAATKLILWLNKGNKITEQQRERNRVSPFEHLIDTLYDQYFPPIQPARRGKFVVGQVNTFAGVMAITEFFKHSYTIAKLNEWLDKSTIPLNLYAKYVAYITKNSYIHNKAIIFSIKKLKIDINTKFNGDTLLTLAASSENKPMITYLIDNGVNIDTPNSPGSTALSLLVQNGRYETAKHLIEIGANVGPSILISAVLKNAENFIKYLIQRGVNINAVDLMDKTARSTAQQFGYTSIIKIFDEAEKNQKDNTQCQI